MPPPFSVSVPSISTAKTLIAAAKSEVKAQSKCYKSVVRIKIWSYALTSIFCQLLFKAMMVLGLRMAIETNSPARIADPTITDVRSYNSISHRPPRECFFFSALADYLAHSPGSFHCDKGRGK